jgi:hypothetical protein
MNSLPYVFYPPAKIDLDTYPNILSIFLAGSIEMGTAPDRQQEIIDNFS